ncbi:hypothetical protein Hanom_Chr03g00271171 [Helianthus anomalus]
MRYKMQTIGTIYVLLAKLGTNCVRMCNHGNYPCTFGKLGTGSKILVSHKDHLCTLF